MTEQSGPFIQTPTTPDVFDLRLGQPSPSLLPVDEVGRAAREAIGPGADPLLLQYGAKRGYAGFVEALARFVAASYGHPVRAEELMVTGGISLGLGLVADVLGRPRGTVAAEDPTYFLARGIFETAGLEVVGIPVDGGGLNVDALESALEGGLEIGFVYTIPSFHNPSSVTLDPRRAARLVELAERHDFVVVADEPYVLLNFGPRPPCFMSYDRGRGRVLSLGSFSKILGPGLRLGWAHGAPALVERMLEHGVLRSGGGLNPVVSAIVHRLLDDGFLLGHVDVLRMTLRRRAQALTSALHLHLPEVRFEAPAGGYFAWLDLGAGVDATELDGRCREHQGVGFAPGPRCAISRDLRRFARVSFAFYDEGELAEAVQRLATGLRG